MELFFLTDALLKKRALYKKNIQFPFDITLYIKMSVRVCTRVYVMCSVCVCWFLFHFDAWKTLFCISFFFLFLLLLCYVKFFSHIRTKMSSNKVELTHTGGGGAAQRFIHFSFSYFRFVSEYQKETQIEEINVCPMPLS